MSWKINRAQLQIRQKRSMEVKMERKEGGFIHEQIKHTTESFYLLRKWIQIQRKTQIFLYWQPSKSLTLCLNSAHTLSLSHICSSACTLSFTACRGYLGTHSLTSKHCVIMGRLLSVTTASSFSLSFIVSYKRHTSFPLPSVHFRSSPLPL